jgi:hypothetical protein
VRNVSVVAEEAEPGVTWEGIFETERYVASLTSSSKQLTAVHSLLSLNSALRLKILDLEK